MSRYIIYCVFSFLVGCSSANPLKNTKIFKYSDFGPQVIAYEVLGQEWWQWEAHGDSRPREYEIDVIVYRGLELETVQSVFPVSPEAEKDYRYVEYSRAINYLDKHISENVMGNVTVTLRNTRNKIISSLSSDK